MSTHVCEVKEVKKSSSASGDATCRVVLLTDDDAIMALQEAVAKYPVRVTFERG